MAQTAKKAKVPKNAERSKQLKCQKNAKLTNMAEMARMALPKWHERPRNRIFNNNQNCKKN